MRKILTLLFGLFALGAAASMAPEASTAAPLAGAAATILADQPANAVKAQYWRHGGYGYYHRPYGYYRRPGFYGGPRFYGRRCFWRPRLVFNGYRYVRRPVRVCR